MNSHHPFRKRFQYWLDNQFSRGTGALIVWLGLLSLALIVTAAALVTLFGIAPEGEGRLSFIEAAWLSLMRTLDPGTMGGDAGWGFRLMMFLVTLGGVFIISTLIGVLTSGVEAKLDELRKGRSEVLESGHTVILGWSQQVFPIITELVEANANLRDSCIVILADRDKVEMEDEIIMKVENIKRTRVVCRSGNPMDLADLTLANLNSARSIIILSPEGEDADNMVIKIALAIINHPKRRPEPYTIIAEIYDAKNMQAARVVGKGEVRWVQVSDFVARVIAQTCRQSGLSLVYTDLLDFGGDEIYLREISRLGGRTYGELLSLFDHNAVMGLVKEGRHARLNPPMNTVVEPGDRIILLAQDDDRIFVTDAIDPAIQRDRQVAMQLREHVSERTIILGWNRTGSSIVHELDDYAAPGSHVAIVCEQMSVKSELDRRIGKFRNLTIDIIPGDTTDRRTLEGLNLAQYDHLIILCLDSIDVQQADARTLVTLLHIRDMAVNQQFKFTIVSEMLDIRNRNLADVTRADDFIVSDKLTSLLVAQLAENPDLDSVFEDLFDPDGAEIYLKPVDWYVKLGEPVSFITILDAARQRGETAIGYRMLRDGGVSDKGGIYLNPEKSRLLAFQAGDRVIVLSADGS